ncbi:SUF system Fe-S cluster assembly regulator [Thiohalorhabdus methylotrophus]|uniref:SUF system Fe-S cluster assembly regulator n=1 Tax=Thiohalorhabdus methylotrophus TaxID=3242694 RepID=A0ABV4TZU4_9GAMM
MLRISKMTDYGTVVMTHLARNPERRFSARELASDLHIGVPTVSKILKVLERGNLLVAQRGKNGGYSLARDPKEISVAQVIRAMEGPIALTECASDALQCEQEKSCSVQSNWQRINHAIMRALEGVSVAEMTEPISVQGVQTRTLAFLGVHEQAPLVQAE